VVLLLFVAGRKLKALCYVIGGNAPILMGRPLLERLGLAVDYENQVMKWPGGDWNHVPLGPRGEYLVHLAEDIRKFSEEDVCDQVLLPEDAENHVFLEERVSLNELVNDPDLVQMAAHAEPGKSGGSDRDGKCWLGVRRDCKGQGDLNIPRTLSTRLTRPTAR
jgi:hypothetical protein